MNISNVLATRVLLFVLLCLCLASISLTRTVRADDLDRYRQQIQEMYVAYYGRPGDSPGIEYWANQLQSAGGNLNNVLDAFGTSSEYRDRFGSLSNTDLVDAIFQRLLARGADPDGLDFYTQSLNRGERSLASIAVDILNGVRGDDLDILRNKLELASFFTERAALAEFEYDESRITAAIALLGAVDHSTESVSQAKILATAIVGVTPDNYLVVELSGPIDGASITVIEARDENAQPIPVEAASAESWVALLGEQGWNAVDDKTQLNLLGLFRVDGVVIPDTLYIVTASGGVETDNNLDGLLDNPGTAVLGQWRALMTGEQLVVTGNRVSMLTDSVLRALEPEIPIRDDP